ncbi:uncharacterized protein DUF1538 [Planifilum fimeticola]|jgi:hypothetical protein|uniref:Uncharacterized protein DUF1538 n=1 Tax=Planifilum fimeticola TaxID=201975 RepID=A0A2T0LH54_9BACL|nr:DUF1538 domain-containing protein [Planifilum fimeticola]PRX41516.1 uncharacterized protein DUF1538 [Planifilum fimeticola]
MNIHVWEGFGEVLWEVAMALFPMLIFFLFFHFFFLKLPKKKLKDIFVGMVLTFLGLALFLQGVHVGFMPAGEAMGQILVENTARWIVIPIGFILGFLAIFAEPAVRVLNQEVEKVSGGYIPAKVLLYTLSIGVAISVALAMLRILWDISLWYLVIPGYVIAFLIAFRSKKDFVSIAFDAGGAATGPMTVTFILSIAIGFASGMEGRDPLMDGFGMIALVALTPILTVLVLGLLYGRKEKEKDEQSAESA